MVQVTYVEQDGTRHVVDTEPGGSLMEAAVRHDVPGIDADCGGACACATCHVYVDPRWWEAVGEPGALEQSMLDFAVDPKDTSRLSCQIVITEALDGLSVGLPASQH